MRSSINAMWGFGVDWLEKELVKIDALPIPWWKKFQLRVIAGKASTNMLYQSRYYLKLREYTQKIEEGV